MIRGSLWSVLGNGAARAFAVATALAAARVLGRESFGALALVQLTITTTGTLVSWQMAQAATRFVSQFRHTAPARASAVAALVTVLSAASGIVAMLTLLRFADWISVRILQQASLGPLLRLASPAVPCVLIAGAQAAILNGYEAFPVGARVNALGSASIFLGVLVGGLVAGIDGAVVGWAAGNGVLCVYGYCALRKFCKTSSPPSTPSAHFPVSALLSYGLPLSAASIVFAVVLLRSNALLGQSHSLAEVALYAAADRIHLILLFVPSAVFTAMFPILSNLASQGDFAGCRQVLRTVLQVVALGLIIPAALTAVFSSRVCSMFGTDFRAGGTVLAVLCIATIFEALNILFGYVLVIASRVWLRSAVDIGLALLLGWSASHWIPRWGSVGLAAACTVSFAAAAITLAVCLSMIRLPRRLGTDTFVRSALPKYSGVSLPRLFRRDRSNSIPQ